MLGSFKSALVSDKQALQWLHDPGNMRVEMALLIRKGSNKPIKYHRKKLILIRKSFQEKCDLFVFLIRSCFF